MLRPSPRLTDRVRKIGFAVIAILCVVASVGYVYNAAFRDQVRRTGPLTGGFGAGGNELVLDDTVVLFENRTGNAEMGQVVAVRKGGNGWPRHLLPLRCLRLHFAAGNGICLAEDPDLPSGFAAYLFDASFAGNVKIALNGIPSRTRVSPDGRYGASTVFVAGHSYAESGFSTETQLYDMTARRQIANLETFTVRRSGQPVKAVDFNYWGVTFTADGNGFFATLGTGGKTYLVKGDIAARSFEILRENVECPSLSPDGGRIAYKKRVGGDFGSTIWRFHVMDLATGADVALAEGRSIDDQMEWLDDDRLLYDDGADSWVLAADGQGRAERYAGAARSPAVLRAGAMPPREIAAAQYALPAADLSIQAALTGAEGQGEATYSATVRNAGPGEAVGVLFEYMVQPGVAYAGAESAGADSWGCSLEETGGRLTCETHALRPDTAWVLKLMFSGPSSAIGGLSRVYGAGPDPEPSNDSARP